MESKLYKLNIRLFIGGKLNISDLACPCCGKIIIVPSFVNAVLDLLSGWPWPWQINSWTRCEKHNSELAGSSKTSAHLDGIGVDIGTIMTKLDEFYDLAREKKFRGIILYRESCFLHLDHKPRNYHKKIELPYNS